MPHIQLLLTLRYYASGSMQICVADFMGVSKSSACRIIKRVSAAIASLSRNYVKFYSNEAELEEAARIFYRIARFPRIIGAIDCSLIPIVSPGGHDAEVFRSRKGYFALNVQTISDASLKIKNIVVRWPGSCHDQTIFKNSLIKRQFENGAFGRYMLVGDSGYTLQPYLMTKLLETRNNAESLYNESIIRTRNVVERQYGVWKRRFPILKNGINLKLETAMNVIVATAVLHNIAIAMREEIPQDWLIDDEVQDPIIPDLPENDNNNNNHLGRQLRQLLINEYFAAL